MCEKSALEATVIPLCVYFCSWTADTQWRLMLYTLHTRAPKRLLLATYLPIDGSCKYTYKCIT